MWCTLDYRNKLITYTRGSTQALCGNKPTFCANTSTFVWKQANFVCKHFNFEWKHANFCVWKQHGNDANSRQFVFLSTAFVYGFVYQLNSRGDYYRRPSKQIVVTECLPSPPPLYTPLVLIPHRAQHLTARRFFIGVFANSLCVPFQRRKKTQKTERPPACGQLSYRS